MAQHLRVTKSLEKKEGVPFPLFDVSMWTVLSQAAVFTTLKPETVEALIHAYNRMVTANEQNKFLADMTYGSTGLLATASFAGRMADPQVKLVHDQYQQSLDDNNDALLGRLADLKTHLEAAIDSVEKEVGIYEIPASTREFVGEGEHAELHVVGETPALKPSDQR